MRRHSLLLLLIVEETIARGECICLFLHRRQTIYVLLHIGVVEKFGAVVADSRMDRVLGSLFW